MAIDRCIHLHGVADVFALVALASIGAPANSDSRCISFEWRLNSWRVPPSAAGRALVNGAASRLHPSGFDRSRIHALLRSRACLGAPPLGARQEQNPDFRGINGPPTARERAVGSPIYSTFGILFLTLAHPAFATWQRCSSSCTS